MHPDVESLLALQTEDQAIGEMEARLAALEPRLAGNGARARVGGRGPEPRPARGRGRGESAARAAEPHRTAQAAARAQHRAARLRAPHEGGDGRRCRKSSKRAAFWRKKRARCRAIWTAAGRAARCSRTASAATRRRSRSSTRPSGRQSSARDAEVDAELAARRATSRGLGGASRAHRSCRSTIGSARCGATARSFRLRGPSCGHCDTSVPMQRRNLMAARGTIEVCETCGVLMYAVT